MNAFKIKVTSPVDGVIKCDLMVSIKRFPFFNRGSLSFSVEEFPVFYRCINMGTACNSDMDLEWELDGKRVFKEKIVSMINSKYQSESDNW